jgi:PhoH-like ATPase
MVRMRRGRKCKEIREGPALSETEQKKIYVLDTNVLIHDPRALSQFDEHDVVLPIAVLEEMDKVKRGFDEAARNVREVSRQLDDLSERCTHLEEGCPLPGGGKLFFELNHRALEILPEPLARGSGDNRIIAVTMSLQREHGEREVVLVSKDINLRIKARALGLKSEDYRSDRVVVEDMDILPLGYMELDEETWTAMAEDMDVTDGASGSHYRVKWPENLTPPCVNGFVVLPGDRERALRCTEVEDDGHVHLHDIRSYRTERHAVWGIQARNLEQNMAMNLLMDPELDMVTLLGRAGSGKTLLALACGLQQTLDQDLYDRIIVTRATVPMGQDIGYLPGTEKEKLEPWMGAVSDNLSLLLEDDFQGLGDLSQYSIEISSLSFARGRTFTRTWLIVDEAQNLTPHQMKTLITRIGEGSKIVILGNNAQIDTPYLTAQTNGLTMAVMRFAYWPHSGHVTLKASERSRLAAYAAEVM